ncbi:MAG: response regulator [Acidobacteriota bacterium]
MRILLADDHAIVRRGLQMVLSLEKDFEIVGEASTGTEALNLVRQLRPDLVLMDLKMPGLGGSRATRLIKGESPGTKVLILTGINVDEEIQLALEAGADGYILKEVSPDELIRAIRIVGVGEAYLQPAVTRHLIEKMQGAPGRAAASPEHPTLTVRECQVLKLMATSATYREIAAQLVVSEETVRSHTKSILAKLGQPNRTQAVLLALREGLIGLD